MRYIIFRLKKKNKLFFLTFYLFIFFPIIHGIFLILHNKRKKHSINVRMYTKNKVPSV